MCGCEERLLVLVLEGTVAGRIQAVAATSPGGGDAFSVTWEVGSTSFLCRGRAGNPAK